MELDEVRAGLTLGTTIGRYEITRILDIENLVVEVRDEHGVYELEIFRTGHPRGLSHYDRFIAENLRWSKIDHPAVTVVDAFRRMETEDDPTACIVRRRLRHAVPLTECMARGPIDVASVREIGRRIASLLAVHPGHRGLGPRTILVEPGDGGDQLYVTGFGNGELPGTVDPDPESTDVVALAQVFRALTREAATELDGVIARMIGERPSMAEVVGLLGEPRPLSIARDPGTEAQLLDQLRARPSDEATRMVYADWLEQRGRRQSLTLLRRERDLPEPERVALAYQVGARWRAVVTQAPITGCAMTFGASCTKRWDAMASTEHDDVRHCGSCDKPIYYCTSLDEAAYRGRRGECIAIDATLIVSSATEAYDDARRPTPSVDEWVGEVAVEPEPPVVPQEPPMWVAKVVAAAVARPPASPKPPDGLLGRIGRWLRRR